MSESSADIESLDGLDTAILNNKGWHLVTQFRVRAGTDGSKAYNHAIDKVQNHNRHAGVRTITKDGVTYHEVWDLWK